MRSSGLGRDFLAGLRVVELGTGLAGGMTGKVLAQFGATVSAVTANFAHGLADDETRLRKINGAQKQHVSSAEALDLAAVADIVIADRITPGDLEDLGLGGDAESYLAAVAGRNRGVWTTLSSFGLSGNQRDHVLDDLTIAAASGVLGYMRTSSELVKPAGRQGLIVTGRVAALATLHGLDRWRAGGSPVHVDVSAQEANIAIGLRLETAHMLYGVPGPAGSARFVGPSGLFPCRDGAVNLVVIEDHHWAAVAKELGSPEWTVGLEHGDARYEHCDMIREKISAWIADQPMEEFSRRLQSLGVPATPMNGATDLQRSVQYEARDFFTRSRSDGPEGPAGEVEPWLIRRRPDATAESDGGRILGLKVCEISGVLAGPLACSFLGAMGADVTRLEDPDRLDVYRRRGPFADGEPGLERGAYFASSNHNKRSRSARLKPDPTGVNPFAVAPPAELVEADIVLQNLGENSARRLGLTGDSTESTVPAKALLVSGSALGSGGPDAHYRAYGHNVHAYGGVISMTRNDIHDPVDFGTSWADPLTALAMATVIAAWALSERRESGLTVDLSMAEVVSANLAEFFLMASDGIDIAARDGRDSAGRAPHGVFPTAGDRKIAISVGTEAQWRGLVGELFDHAPVDPRFATVESRWEHRRKLEQLVAQLVAGHDRDSLFAALQKHQVPAAPVWSAEEVVDDPHLAQREFFPAVVHPVLGRRRMIGMPWRFTDGGRPVLIAAPTLQDG